MDLVSYEEFVRIKKDDWSYYVFEATYGNYKTVIDFEKREIHCVSRHENLISTTPFKSSCQSDTPP